MLRVIHLILLPFLVSCNTSVDHWEWQAFGGDAANSQYAPLEHINTGNVHLLEQVWIYNTGDHRPPRGSQIQTNPIIVNGTLYGVSPGLKVFALDAATGENKWTYDPFADGSGGSPLNVSRGLAHWTDGEEHRVFFTVGSNLVSINAQTGELNLDFGDDGKVDLKKGLGRDAADLYFGGNTPGVIFQDLYIVGGRVSEDHPAAPGHVRAYNVHTGEIVWIFHTIPHPGEPGYETWPPEAWETLGGANVWTGMSVDHERGIVFLPTGSAAFDFWGGNRPGDNLYANSLVALDAATGEHIWHFQFVRHDIWDRDLPAAPNLMTIRHNGRKRDVVAQITKSGHVFVFDRETGDPIFPIEEQEYPASDVPGEIAAATQPLPTLPPPFSRQRLDEADINDMDPAVHQQIVDSLRTLRNDGQFVPPSMEGTVIFPGFDGGGEWGGAAHDPKGILYINGNEMPWVLQIVSLAERMGDQQYSAGQELYFYNCGNCHGFGRQGAVGFPALNDIASRMDEAGVTAVIRNGGARMPSFSHLTDEEVEALTGFLMGDEADVGGIRPGRDRLPFSHMGYNRFVDDKGFPVVKPPWGTLNAIDLNKGEIKWTVPLGEVPELMDQGIPQTGTENYGGPLVTAGGVLFIGASKDEHFRAHDMETGEELWKTRLPAGGYATPATYTVDGKQYVVIAAGGGKMGTDSGDAYVAFALPD